MKMYELDSSNYISRKEKLEEVLNILKIGYNLRGAGDIYRVFESDEDVLLDKYIWNIVESDNNEVLGVTIYNNKDKMSRKISLFSIKAEQDENGSWFTSKEAKEARNMLLSELLPENKHKKVWGEVSGALEHIIVDKMELKPCSQDEAFVIMANQGKLVVPESDGIHYKRNIGGEFEHKVIVGNIPTYLKKQNDDYQKIKKLIVKNINDRDSIEAIAENIKDECLKEKIKDLVKEYYPDYIDKYNDNVE